MFDTIMIVYNITMKIAPQVEKEWLEWQKGKHIPDVMATGLFNEYKFFRLLEQDDTEGATYVVQYFASSIDKYKEYTEKFAPPLRDEVLKKWGRNFIAFRTVMEVVV